MNWSSHLSRIFYAVMFTVLAFGIAFVNDRLILTPPYRLFFQEVNPEAVAALHLIAAGCLLWPVYRDCPRDLKWAFPAIGICHMWAVVAVYPYFATDDEPGNIVSLFAWIMVGFGIFRGCVWQLRTDV